MKCLIDLWLTLFSRLIFVNWRYTYLLEFLLEYYCCVRTGSPYLLSKVEDAVRIYQVSLQEQIMSCYVMLCYVMLCFVLYFIVLHCIALHRINYHSSKHLRTISHLTIVITYELLIRPILKFSQLVDCLLDCSKRSCSVTQYPIHYNGQ